MKMKTQQSYLSFISTVEVAVSPYQYALAFGLVTKMPIISNNVFLVLRDVCLLLHLSQNLMSLVETKTSWNYPNFLKITLRLLTERRGVRIDGGDWRNYK